MIKRIVSKNRPDAFTTISEALASVKDQKEEILIYIEPGTYEEKVTVDQPFITLEGEDAKSTIITYGDFANDTMPDQSKRGTFRSYTMFLDAHDITLKNLTIENSAFPRSKAGQAIALYADGDRLLIENCILKSYQDTLFTGPLPPTVIQPGGFVGPKEFAPRIMGRHYYRNCYICGDIDFIFGSATAYFEDCEIASVYSEVLPETEECKTPTYGYVTAASTPEGTTYGYVFNRCNFTSTCPKRSVYLGRPWRDYAKTIIMNSYLGPHIKEEGFHDWNKQNAHDSMYYAEYHNLGEGYTPLKRAPYIHQLTDEEAALYTPQKVLASNDGWNPADAF